MNIKRNFLHWIIYDRHTLSEQRCRFWNHQRRDPIKKSGLALTRETHRAIRSGQKTNSLQSVKIHIF